MSFHFTKKSHTNDTSQTCHVCHIQMDQYEINTLNKRQGDWVPTGLGQNSPHTRTHTTKDKNEIWGFANVINRVVYVN